MEDVDQNEVDKYKATRAERDNQYNERIKMFLNNYNNSELKCDFSKYVAAPESDLELIAKRP